MIENWHDFPNEDGLYFIKGDGQIFNFLITKYPNGPYYYRPSGGCWPYDYLFNPDEYAGKCFGPIKLPTI
jgi:hypothetical protein